MQTIKKLKLLKSIIDIELKYLRFCSDYKMEPDQDILKALEDIMNGIFIT